MNRSELISEIKTLQAKGLTSNEIAASLNSRGIKTLRGEKFQSNSVLYMANAKNERPVVTYERVPPAPQPSEPSNHVMVLIGRPDQLASMIQGALR